MMEITRIPVVKVGMLIRRPVAEVFEAFIDPAITSKFWFTKGGGRLETGKRIQWDWEMFGVSAEVSVKAIEANQHILIEWSPTGGNSTTVEWLFAPRADNTTFVTITESGFSGDGDEVVQKAIGSQGGFAFLLSGLKAFLEHNIALNLTADHAPDNIKKN
ncbi:MAG: SRPBCC family protein [Pyrinomonadaceae bacterium]|nr:SRPBCC family protein [Pyrinomonadaceae bacterium]